MQVAPSIQSLPTVPPIRPSAANMAAFGPALGFFVDMYVRYGTAARIATAGSQLVVASGQEANRFVAQSARSHLVVGSFREAQNEAYGANHTLVSRDGEAHTLLRSMLQEGYHRTVLAKRQTQASEAALAAFVALPTGVPLDLTTIWTPIIYQVLGAIMVQHDPGSVGEDVTLFLRTVVARTLAGQYGAHNDQAYHKARQASLAYADTVVQEHRCPMHNRQPDLVDALLAGQQAHPDILPDQDVRAGVLAPFIGGLDTLVCACSFMLVAILCDQQRHEKVQQELAATTESTGAALPLLAAVMRETLRRYPPTPILRATAVQSFKLGELEVMPDEDVAFGINVTHTLANFFPDPLLFTEQRWREVNQRPPYVYAPFGLGPHTCLGAGLAEALIVWLVATMLRQTSCVLEQPQQASKLPIAATPTPFVDQRVRVIVQSR